MRENRSRRGILVGVVGALVLPVVASWAPLYGAAAAGPQGSSATATLTVHAHVVRSCVLRVFPINFGDYDPLVANATQPKDRNTGISVECTKGITPKVELDNGSNAQGNTRRMAAGGDYLEYEVYSDLAHTSRWGSGSQAVAFPTSMGPGGGGVLGAGVSGHAVYARIPAGQNVPPGDYNDTVTATVIF